MLSPIKANISGSTMISCCCCEIASNISDSACCRFAALLLRLFIWISVIFIGSIIHFYRKLRYVYMLSLLKKWRNRRRFIKVFQGVQGALMAKAERERLGLSDFAFTYGEVVLPSF